jgi:hypothetical protein
VTLLSQLATLQYITSVEAVAGLVLMSAQKVIARNGLSPNRIAKDIHNFTFVDAAARVYFGVYAK